MEEPWVMKNRRRVYLIDKKYRDGLSPSEAVELRQLQEDVSRQVNTVAPPLPEKPLEALEALARWLEQGDAQQDGQEWPMTPAEALAAWYDHHGCTHAHCPDGCHKPQPILLADGRLVCGRCLIRFNEVCEMIPCSPETCGGEA